MYIIIFEVAALWVILQIDVNFVLYSVIFINGSFGCWTVGICFNLRLKMKRFVRIQCVSLYLM